MALYVSYTRCISLDSGSESFVFETYLNNTEALIACASSDMLMPELSLMLVMANFWFLRVPKYCY